MSGAKNTPPEGVARVSRTRFCNFVPLARAGVLENVSSAYSRAGVGWDEVKQGVKPDNYKGNMVREPALWRQVGSGEVAKSCHPYV